MSEGNTRYARNEEYNALTGKYERKAILNDIVNTSARTAGTGADLALAAVAPASGFDMFPYYIYIAAPDAITFAITSGSSTIAYRTFTGAGFDEIKADGLPLTKLSSSATLTVRVLSATSGSTYDCHIISERRPVAATIQNQ